MRYAGMTARDLAKIREFHLQGDGAPANARRLAMAPDFRDDRFERGARRVISDDVLEEGVFRADRFADAVGAHWPLVDAARDPIII